MRGPTRVVAIDDGTGDATHDRTDASAGRGPAWRQRAVGGGAAAEEAAHDGA
jgi:hypothetical protein